MRNLKIALDFDDTITVDPEFWSLFIALAKKYKHEVTIVTFRNDDASDNDDIEYFALKNKVDIVYTNFKQKSACFNADIWIDDLPILIPSYEALAKMKIGCEVNNERTL